MKKPTMRTGLFSVVFIMAVVVFAAAPAFADKQVTGDFSGKTKCENGMKKAGFKTPNSTNLTWYSLNDVSHQIQALSWPEPGNAMSFDDREKQKTSLTHVQKLLRQLSCDTQDNGGAQSNGLLSGAQNGMQQGTKANSNVQPQQPGAQ